MNVCHRKPMAHALHLVSWLVACTFGLALMNADSGVLAGTSARQGEGPSGITTQRFKSPMVLETDFLLLSQKMWDKKWYASKEYRTLGKYSCEEVTIADMGMNVEKLDASRVRIGLRGLLSNSRSYDKLVTLRIEVLNGEAVAASGTTKPISLEDGDEEYWGLTITSQADVIKSEPPSRLRITMWVDENNG